MQQWYADFPDELKKLAEETHGFIGDLFTLKCQFQLPTLLQHVDEGLSSPFAHLYRKIVFNLAANAIAMNPADMKLTLQALSHEFYHPDNTLATFFTPKELEMLTEYMQNNADYKAQVVASLTNNRDNAISGKTLLKFPKIILFLRRDYTETTYTSFAGLHHATQIISLWIDLAQQHTEHNEEVYSQAVECLNNIVLACRSNTVTAHTRGIVQYVLEKYKILFDLFPDKALEVQRINARNKSMLKSKQAVVKLFGILG